ncbi:unnamed protein product [Parascedosporium putredinis]|uniref:Uncharacterized protein n=1 Tax=Parascedosporium putredinis TaxID=1442378 RepID=A0A9P1MCF9_9PEZI|nr:unnamed protein product [Parascedosporium putredinis]CAI7998332.1 unnamed protein product [Parascedosporium putredinis]
MSSTDGPIFAKFLSILALGSVPRELRKPLELASTRKSDATLETPKPRPTWIKPSKATPSIAAMQTQLEVGRAARHPRVIIAPPRLNLRRAGSYQHEKGPLSSTSSRFNFNHLFFSPTFPEPSRPRPPAKKSPTRPRPSRVLRILAWLLSTVFVFYVAAHAIRKHVELAGVKLTYLDRNTGEDEVEMVSRQALPDFPTPVITEDKWGRSKWTVSIPKKHPFPLSVSEYSEMSRACKDVQATVRSQREWTGTKQQPFSTMHGKSDSHYVDVREAAKSGLLPNLHSEREAESEGRQTPQFGSFVGVNKDSYMSECDKSLTVVLETDEAGIGHTLMMLWTFYGLAKEQGRSFLSRIADGLVSAATAKDVLVDSLSTRKANGAAAADDDDDYTRKILYDFARRGYEALFHLANGDVEYIDGRVQSLTAQAAKSKLPIAGMHIRRGDCHPLEFPYRDSYIPNEVYADAARTALKKKLPEANTLPLLVVASDDPMVHGSPELVGAHHAQDRIKLASKETLDKSGATGSRDRSIMHRFKDETFGWEGGFFSTMFWNLGMPKGQAGNHETRVSTETVALRTFLARAYLLDLSVLARAGDAVVCSVGSMGCRILGVMMGWREVSDGGRWLNIDGEHKWMGLTW